MKNLFIIASIFLTINSFGQELTRKLSELGLQDSTINKLPSLSNLRYYNADLLTIVYINDRQASLMELYSINPKNLDSTDFSKDNKSIKINGKISDLQLYFKTKNNYQPKRISLKEIRKKYSKDQRLSCFYFLNNKLAMVNEEDIFLDENNILGISCHIYFNTEQNRKLNFIEIFTRSENNIKNAHTVIIR